MSSFRRLILKFLDPRSYCLSGSLIPEEAPGSSEAWGMITISKNLQFKCLDILSDHKGRYLFLKCMTDDSIYKLASNYAPNVDQLNFIHNNVSHLNVFKPDEVLIGRDIDHILHYFFDRSSSRCPNPLRHSHNRYTRLKQIFDSLNLVGVWRKLYSSSWYYMYFPPVHQSYKRIHYLLCTKIFFSSVHFADIGPKILSDHAWVSCSLSYTSTHGKGLLWSFCKSLLC